jgi:DNA-binding HxlR family transcriptional regulator
MKQRRYKSYDLGTGCAVEACLEVIGGKWKGVILHHLMTHTVLRFATARIGGGRCHHS